MELSLSVYFFRWFLTVVVWQTTVWRTVYMSECSTTIAGQMNMKSSPTEPSTQATETDNNTLSLASSSSSSQTTAGTTFTPNTSSSQTTSLETQQDIITTSFSTTYQTNNTVSSSQAATLTVLATSVQDTSSSQTTSLETGQDNISSRSVTALHTFSSTGNQSHGDVNKAVFDIIDIAVGVSGGIVLIAIVILVVAFLRNKRRAAKLPSKTEAASDKKLTQTTNETEFHNYEVVDLQGNTPQPESSHSVDIPRTFQEKTPVSRIQGLDVKQTTLMRNAAYQSVDDQMATPHDDVTGRKHKKSKPHDGFSKLPDFMIQSTSMKKTLEDRDDASNDDGMLMSDNVAYESLASFCPRNTSSTTKQPLPKQEVKGDDENDVVEMIINDTYVSA